LTVASYVHAASLYFEKFFVKTSSEATCYRFAADAARLQGLQNIHSNRLEVAGERGGAYLSITCVGRGNQSAAAIVMSSADSFAVAKQQAGQLAARIRNMTCIDSPC
jgi:hypothetical protein